MDPTLDLEQVIADSVNDATFDTAPEVDVTPIESVDSSPEVSSSEPPPDAGAETIEADPSTPTESNQVASPGAAAQPKDDFERLAGMPAIGVAGRENRIPYSRVKKITERAATEAETKIAESVLGRKLVQGEKAADVVKAHVAQLPTLQAQNQDYEQRLNTVGQFETVLAQQPEQFLQMLAKLPAYGEFFKFVEMAYDAYEKGAFGQPAGAKPVAGQVPPQSPAAQQPVGDDMPEPDETLPDGSKQYTMDGVRRLLEWNSKKVAADVTKNITSQFDARFKPMETEWQAQKRIEATLPVIRMQIAEARTWPLFNDHENDIVKLMEANKTISLEAAYRQVVFPKILADRSKIRQDVISDLQRAPANTPSAVPGRAPTKPNPPANQGPRSLEDVIKESLANATR